MLQLVARDVGPRERGREGERRAGGGGRVGRERREGGRRILSVHFYFYSSTSLTVTPSPPLHYPSIPRLQSLFVSKATASHVSLTTSPPTSPSHLVPHRHPTALTPPHQISIANAVIITVSQRRGESGRESGKT